MENAGQGGVAVGAVVSKICHTAPGVSHCTRPGVSCGAVADRFSFDSIIMVSEEETDEGGRGALLCGCGEGWGWLSANKELDVLEL